MSEIDDAVTRAINDAPKASPEVDPLEYLAGQLKIAQASEARLQASLEGVQREIRDLNRVMAAVELRRREARGEG